MKNDIIYTDKDLKILKKAIEKVRKLNLYGDNEIKTNKTKKVNNKKAA